MKIFRTISPAHRFCAGAPRPVVLVPTMGALHAGHGRLFIEARRIARRGGTVIASIFVNPTQFGAGGDLSRYPRPFAEDARLCRDHGVDAILHPSADEMYPAGFSTWVNEESVGTGLCGAARAGHFRGVCTVVMKLFQIVQPTDAIFGRKDAQQCAVIARMVRDLNVPVRLHFAETVREPDGLALSSRNAYLSEEERSSAPLLYAGLVAAREARERGVLAAFRLRKVVEKLIRTAPGAHVDYIEIVDAETLLPVKRVERPALIAIAVFFGKTRLIDNILLPGILPLSC